MFPYEPLYPENVTVPEAAAAIGVPAEFAMSNPVCDDLLIALPAPNLDVIVPDTGLIKDIPKLAFPDDVVNCVFTLPLDAYLFDVVFFFATTTFGFSTYNFDIASSWASYSFFSTSYFSTIDILSILLLFFSFSQLTTASACSKLDT